jgi:hypothetical protein
MIPCRSLHRPEPGQQRTHRDLSCSVSGIAAPTNLIRLTSQSIFRTAGPPAELQTAAPERDRDYSVGADVDEYETEFDVNPKFRRQSKYMLGGPDADGGVRELREVLPSAVAY